MIGPLTRFARDLRAAGVPCSPAELRDAAAALEAAGITERETVRLALRACCAKQAEHLPIFDRLFEATFRATWPRADKPVRGKPRPDQPGQRRRPPDEPAPGPAALRRQAEQERRNALARLRWEQQRDERSRLGARPLGRRIEPLELSRLEREVERLGRLLRTRWGRRRRQSARGDVDLRATIARAARTGGVPLSIVRRRRLPARPRLLLFCDVSGSVIRTARLLLRFVHEAGRLFSRTDGFVFVDRPVPAAPLFRHAEFDAALAELDRLPGLDLHALSDFGNAFERLWTDQTALLTRQTTLLVLGDARCNRFDPRAWALEAIAARVHRVVWLNPERRPEWYTADSRLRDYESQIDHLLPCESLEELAAAMDRLIAVTRC